TLHVGLEVLRSTAAELEQRTTCTAEGRTADALDTKASLLIADHVWTQLEVGATAGDAEVEAGSVAQARVDLEAEFQRRGIDCRFQPATRGLHAVDTSHNVGAGFASRNSSGRVLRIERSADRLSTHKCIRAVFGRFQF